MRNVEIKLLTGWYTALSQVGELADNSDIMTDYFEKPRIRVRPGSKYFDQVEKLAKGETV